jgi:hypothetical protein
MTVGNTASTGCFRVNITSVGFRVFQVPFQVRRIQPEHLSRTTDPGTAMPIEVKDGNMTGADITIQTLSAGTFGFRGVAINLQPAQSHDGRGRSFDLVICTFSKGARVLDSVNPPSVATRFPRLPEAMVNLNPEHPARGARLVPCGAR